MKKVVLNVAMAVAATAGALLVVEGAFRLLRSGAPQKWSDRPYAYFLEEPPAERRNPPVPSEAADVFRIAVVGDSFTFGPHLQVEDTFPKRLERWLNLNHGARKVEVLNLGVSGFSTFDEVKVAEQALKYQQANLLVLEITLNDALLRALDRRTREELFGSPYKKHAFFRTWSSLGYLAERLHATATYQRYLDYHRKPFHEPETSERFKTALRHMTKLAKERGVPMVAMIFPLFDFPFDAKYPLADLHDLIGGVLTEQGVPFLDLLHAYDRIPHQHLQIIPGADSHPNEIAHRIAAERLLGFLSTKSLVPSEAVPTRILGHRKDSRPRPISQEKAWQRGMKGLGSRP